MIIYGNIPCPVLLKKEPDTFLILFKGEQKWIFGCSLGYGEIVKNRFGVRYFFNGKFHRENRPACEYSGGDRYWYKNGKLHRLDGPAVEYTNGTKKWYQNGLLHREDGPAVEFVDGYKEWHQSGKLHRLDGPAVEWSDGNKEWFINGRKLEYIPKKRY